MPHAVIEITVNGDKRTIAPAQSVADLLAELGLSSGRVAVERNLVLVPRAEHGATKLEANDVVEIVHVVGGG